MNNFLMVLAIAGFLTIIACGQQEQSKFENELEQVQETVAEKVHYYTCPMEAHKHIASDAPGDCSECGMKLVTAVETEPANMDYYGCPMSSHSHIRHEKSGKCEECSMELKPMKLVSK